MNRVRAGREPLAEDEAVERVQHQPFRPAGRGRDRADVLRPQALRTQLRERPRPGVDAQRRSLQLSLMTPQAMRAPALPVA